jgi:methylase of polypeptide subunit release factors
LDGGESGLKLIDELLQKAPAFVNKPGLILLEIEATLGAQTLELAQRYFPDAEVSLHQDLAERDRMIRIELK